MSGTGDPQAPGRERILAAALELFAARGYDAVTMRDIANAADVSPALVVHHFATKDGLRAAVDAHVTSIFDGLREAALGGQLSSHDTEALASGFADLLLANLPTGSPIPAYLRRLILDGDAAGRRFFLEWYRLSHDVLSALEAAGVATPSTDRDVRAAFLMVNDLAMVLLHEHIADAIGIDPLTEPGLRRWSIDVIDAYTSGVFRREHP